MKAPSPTKPQAKRSGAKTIYMDLALFTAGKTYASFRPKIRSISNLIESLLMKELRANGPALGIKIPAHLLVK